MFSKDEFRKYAIKDQGISSATIDSYQEPNPLKKNHQFFRDEKIF